MNALKQIDDFWNYRPLLWGVVLLFVSFFLWAAISQIDQHVVAAGRIVPAGNARTVQHLEGGIVQQILVREGQTVKRGETLFLVANTMAKSRLQELELELSARQVARIRIQTELDQQDAMNVPELYLSEHPDLVAGEQVLFKANRKQHLESMRALEERRRQKDLALDALVAKVDNLEKEQAISARQAQLKQKLFKSGATSEAQYLAAFSAHRKLVTTLEQARNEMPIVRAELQELDSRLSEKEQEHFAGLSETLSQTDLEIKTLSERAQALRDEVTRSAIVSPIAGTLNKLYIHTEGGVIQAGAPVAEITPAEEALVVEGQISIADRGKVWPGLSVMTKVSAYDFTIFGGIGGELTYISPDSFVDKQNIEHYKVRVELADSHILNYPDLPLRPGMTVEVSILTGKRSVLAALLKPVTDISARALRET
ncbi:MAG: HlyD family type I secretion periplasmic adaptor subunit [Pseudomonadota bacterium]